VPAIHPPEGTHATTKATPDQQTTASSLSAGTATTPAPTTTTTTTSTKDKPTRATSTTKTDTIDRYKAKIKAATHKIEAVRAKIDKLIGDRPDDYDIDAVAAAIDDMTDGDDTKRQRVRIKQRRLKEIATEINCNIRALAAAMVGKTTKYPCPEIREWLIDTGSGNDLIDAKTAAQFQKWIRGAKKVLKLATAGGNDGEGRDPTSRRPSRG